MSAELYKSFVQNYRIDQAIFDAENEIKKGTKAINFKKLSEKY